MKKQDIQDKVVSQYHQDPMTMKIERVAAYIRVSTAEQKLHGLSLDAQRMKLQQYADNHGLKIVGWYVDEGVSGRKLIRRRPELQRMIHDAQKGLFDRIIFIKLDRFFRSIAEYHECMKLISPVLWTATEEEYDLTTANGRMLVNMKLTIAELEADQTGERIDLVNEYKVQTGQPLSGSTPFCFMIITDEQTGRKKIVKNPEYEEMTYDMIQHLLVHQSRRKTLHYINEKYGTCFEYKALMRVFQHSWLYGEYRGNPSYIEDPYIDKKTFDKIQEITKRNLKVPKSKRCYIFTGLILCPECGRTLKSGTTDNNGKRGDDSYKVYRCNHRMIQGQCAFNRIVYERTIEKLLLKNFEVYLNDAKVRSAEVSVVPVKKAKPDIKKIQAEIDRLNYSWRTGKIAKVEDYERDFEELKAKLEEAQMDEPEVPQDFSAIEEALGGDWRDIYNMLDDEHKRAFWRKYIKSIEIDWTVKGKGNKRITKVNFF